MSLYELATPEQKKQLRKIKNIDTPNEVVEATRNALVKGCLKQPVYVQFAQDVRVYGLWEALLYAESYEKSEGYAPGTVENAFKAAAKVLNREAARGPGGGFVPDVPRD